MKKNILILQILFLLAGIFNYIDALPQPPDKNLSNSQYQQTLNTFTKQIADLEKEIAADKAANADPRKIKNKETQLANLKSMLAMMKSNNQPAEPKKVQEPATAVKKAEPYKSPIVPINVTRPVTAPTEAQAVDELLWFKGKKIDKNTLMTKGGMLVRYDPQKNQIIFQPAKNADPFVKIDQELSKTEQRKNEFLQEVTARKNSFFFYPATYAVYEGYDLLAESMKTTVKNTKSLPSLSPATASVFSLQNDSYGSGPYPDMIQSFLNDASAIENYREIIAREYRKLQNLLNNLPPNDVPQPPVQNFYYCSICADPNSSTQKTYSEIIQWSQKFFEFEEHVLIETIMKIELALLKLQTENNPPEYYISKNVDENLKKELKTTLEKVFERMDEKMKKLIDLNKNIPECHYAIIKQVLEYQRLRQAYDIKNASSLPKSGELIKEFSQIFSDKITEKMRKWDYLTVLNLHSIYLYETQLEVASGGEYSSQDWAGRIDKFNNFKMQFYIEFDYQVKGFNDELKLQATGLIYTLPEEGIDVKLGMNNCKWQLFIADANYENPSSDNEFSVPLIIKEFGSIKKVKENEKMNTYKYSGPAKLRMLFPASGIGLCPGENEDSLILQLLHYDTEADYSALAKTVNKSYSVDFLAYANRLFTSSKKIEANKDKISEIALTLPSRTSDSFTETGNPILDKLKGYFFGAQKRQELQKQSTQLGGLDASFMNFDAKNESQVLFEQQTDIDVQNPKQRESIKGKIYLKVIQSNKAAQ